MASTIQQSASAIATQVAVSAVRQERKGATAAALRSPAGATSLSRKEILGTTIGLGKPLTASPQSRDVKVLAAGREFEVELDKPLGLNLANKEGGGIVVAAVIPGSNAAKAGVKVGDQILYCSSFFGDELWPADNLQFTQSAIRARPSVYFVIGRGVDVDVKRLPKTRPLPSRFGKVLTEAQKERATHICLDCGYIYYLPKPFDEQPEGFECPQCSAPKKRFVAYDPVTGKALGGGTPIFALISFVVGIAGVGALLVYGLQ